MRRNPGVSEKGDLWLRVSHLNEAILDLRQLSASYGEELWVTGIRPYTMEMFAADYNRAKPDGLENTELRRNNGLSVRVEEGEFVLDGPRMSHFKGTVSVKAGFGDARPVKITKGVRGFSLRLHDPSSREIDED